MIVSSSKYNVQEVSKSMYETRMTLTVRRFQKDDVGSYRCIAKNSLGEVDSSIRLYEIPGPSRKVTSPKYGTDSNDVLKHKVMQNSFQPDDEDQYGSAEDFDDSDFPNPYHKPTKPTLLDNNRHHNSVVDFGMATRKPPYTSLTEVRGAADNELTSYVSSAKDIVSISSHNLLTIFTLLLLTS
ncbi:unnamed protein product [Hermetia illucens]|uniref:Immunoglobulin I-set domain-containing protein n=2 Tax=Hermetia illucens TaxID=343691 RepID=A0A7R8Z0L9_HERIL|nr:unnamed protein product [Hermetia illucens]